MDPSEASFVKAPASGQTLSTLVGQVNYSNSLQGQPIQFPTSAVEIKADWLPNTSLQLVNGQPAFDCNQNPPQGVYVENITDAKGKVTCMALVGIHVSSKLLTDWLWATFEPQNTVTNPNRCNPNLYNSCIDPWGSSPATSTGATTSATSALTTLMTQAALPAVFQNYRLVVAQSSFTCSQQQGNCLTALGNSFTEYNAGVAAQQASCITCHHYALVTNSTSNPQINTNFSPFSASGTTQMSVGLPVEPLPPATSGSAWISEDFSYMLMIMPQGTSAQNHKKPPAKKK